eukprot:6455976-Prymnesium_polylepis.1
MAGGVGVEGGSCPDGGCGGGEGLALIAGAEEMRVALIAEVVKMRVVDQMSAVEGMVVGW